MNVTKKWVLTTVLAGSIAGGALGGTVLSSAVGNAATGATTTAGTTTTAAPSGKFVPNEDTTHETNESAAREAQEDAGQFPTVP
jgi:hypothetical protein